jgi:RNA polymerase sigma factor (sigma-70 family)
MRDRKNPPDGSQKMSEARRARLEKEYMAQKPRLERYVRKTIVRTADGQDVQDLLHRVYLAIAERDPDLPDIRDYSSYLKVCARNAVIAFNQETEQASALEVRLGQPIGGDGPDGRYMQIATEDSLHVLAEGVTADDVKLAIQQLQPLERSFAEMELKGNSSKQIAEILGIKKDRAERVMTEMHKQLRSLLSDVMQGRVR